jgi:hypothetical protein
MRRFTVQRPVKAKEASLPSTLPFEVAAIVPIGRLLPSPSCYFIAIKSRISVVREKKPDARLKYPWTGSVSSLCGGVDQRIFLNAGGFCLSLSSEAC